MASKNKSGKNSRQNKSTPSRKAPNRSNTANSRAVSTGATRTSTVEAKPSTTVRITRDAVAEAAYCLWLQRGGEQVSNWIEAERLLREKTSA